MLVPLEFSAAGQYFPHQRTELQIRKINTQKNSRYVKGCRGETEQEGGDLFLNIEFGKGTGSQVEVISIKRQQQLGICEAV